MKNTWPLMTIILLLITSNAYGQLTEESDFALTYGDEDIISIATGASQPIARRYRTSPTTMARPLSR